jgi:hypothetical protein
MAKLNRAGDRWLFECPGCGCAHFFNDTWQFNGDQDRPSVRPSIKVTGKRSITDEEHARIMAGEKVDIPGFVCHSFVTDGKIQFLDDCTHELAGQTVELPDW